MIVRNGSDEGGRLKGETRKVRGDKRRKGERDILRAFRAKTENISNVLD